MLGPISSKLSLDSKSLNLLSPRRFPKLDFLSVGAGCEVPGPNEKLPNAPIGEKLAFCDAEGHGDVGPLTLALSGLVALRLSDPNGELRSAVPSRPAASLSLSSSLASDESRKSVFRRRRDAGGVDVFGSSRKNRELLVGDMGLPIESPVSRRLVPCLPELGDDALLKELRWPCDCEIEVLRPAGPPLALLSFDALCGGGLRGELTDVEKS
jgi:hypothetical protein